MSSDSLKNPDVKPPSDSGSGLGTVGWFLLGILPIPIGLLIDPSNIFPPFANNAKGMLWGFIALTVVLATASAIGMSGKFSKSVTGRVGYTLFFTLWTVGFNLLVVFFAGCCSALRQV